MKSKYQNPDIETMDVFTSGILCESSLSKTEVHNLKCNGEGWNEDFSSEIF